MDDRFLPNRYHDRQPNLEQQAAIVAAGAPGTGSCGPRRAHFAQAKANSNTVLNLYNGVRTNSLEISRFTTCVLQSGIEMPYRAIQTNIAEALNIVIQIEPQPSVRFVPEIVSIERYDPDNWRYDLQIIYRR